MTTLLQELFTLRERDIIEPENVETVVDDIKFAFDHIKTKLPANLDFEELTSMLQDELSLNKKEAGIIANLLTK